MAGTLFCVSEKQSWVKAHQSPHCTCVRLPPTPAAVYPRSAGRGQTLKLKGLSSLSAPNPPAPVRIPEESGQSLVMETVGGADPTQGQEQGRSLGLSTLLAAEVCQPRPGAALSGDLGTQHLL